MFSLVSNSSQKVCRVALPEKLEKELEGILANIYQVVEKILLGNFPQKKFVGRTSLLTSADYQVKKLLREKELKKSMDLFYSFWNQHAKNFGTVSQANRTKLRLLTIYLLETCPEHVKHARLIVETFKQLTKHIISNGKFKTRDSCLKPSQFFNKKSFYSQSVGQKEILSDEHFEMKQTVLNFLQNPTRVALPAHFQLIYGYLKGRYALCDIPLNKENARSYLICCKIMDIAIAEYNQGRPYKLALARSSFEMRTCILEICSPLMTTGEVYTKTLDPRKFKDRAYLSNPAHWMPERVRHHLAITANQIVSFLSLSEQLHHLRPAVMITRGNTAAGKSTAIPQEARLKPVLNENNQVIGILTPDTAKKYLRTDIPLLNHQVHDEGVALYNETLAKISEEAKKTSLNLEGRYTSIEDIEAILAVAKMRDAEVTLSDIETPLLTVLLRVLERNPYNHQCPPLQDIVKGYKESAVHLKKLIDIVAKEPAIKFYKLYFNDECNHRYLVAEKQQNKFHILSPSLLEKCSSMPTDLQINEMLATPITKEQIDRAIELGCLAKTSKELLYEWEGLPLGLAVDMHALGTSAAKARELIHFEASWRALYGEINVQPFDGLWLNDLPAVKRHIETEQRLHIRGTDDLGKGLHFQTGKFTWKLNPDFNPDARLPGCKHAGFQMRIGYFIVPTAKADTFVAQNLSSSIRKELEVHSESGELIGYRLFVHPEAYQHFKALHAAGMPFVQPQFSEFMGAPTSSYRSWVVRRLVPSDQESSVPFIAKFGVASTPTDVRRLLPRAEIEKSIKTQRTLDELSKECCHQEGLGTDLIFFKENFGLALRDIDSYPPAAEVGAGMAVDSGMLIREFPQALLAGTCQILSFSAVMSVERTKPENFALGGRYKKYAALPLIYELIEVAMQKKLVKSSFEFINTYIIKNYFEAIEELHMRHGISLAAHGQNLCLVLNQDSMLRGFAYRDMEGVSLLPQEKFLESYALFRHHIVTKIANVLVCHEENIAPQKGAPTQMGSKGFLPERALFRYMISHVNHDKSTYQASVKTLLDRYISWPEYQNILKMTDAMYIARLKFYYDVDASGVLQADGTLPAAESGSKNEYMMHMGDLALCQHRKINLPEKKASVVFRNTLPKTSAIMLFERPSLVDFISIRIGHKHFCLPNELYRPFYQRSSANKPVQKITITDIMNWHQYLNRKESKNK